MVEQVFLPMGEIWFMHNVDTQFTVWRGVRSKGREFLKIYFHFQLPWIFVAARGLLSSCSEWNLLFTALLRFLTVVASLLQSWGSRHLGLAIAGLLESSWTRY